jgi:lysyl-tRNA synthetase class 2
MDFRIGAGIFDAFPEAKIGVLVVKGLDNSDGSAAIAGFLRVAEETARKGLSVEALAAHPRIDDWRRAYRKFGSDPKTYKNSLEALLRRVLKGGTLPSINPLVDAYNAVSIKHLFPAGGSDLDLVEGDITLTFANGGEQFVPLGNANAESVLPGEVVYKDDASVLCRRWNWRESEKSKMTDATRNVCLVLEGLESSTRRELSYALAELASLLCANCGGTARASVLDGEKMAMEIP